MSNKRKLETKIKDNNSLLKKLTIEKTTNLISTNVLRTIYLNEEKTSWIKLFRLESPNSLTMADFEQLWSLKPNEKLQIKIAGKLISCPRYAKSYLHSYKFSGLNHEADMNLPARIQTLLNYAKVHFNADLNQSLLNWYECGGSIGKHSDDTRQLKENSDIFSFSFGPAKRNFILEPKKVDSNQHKYNILLEHNTLVVMGGKCQQTHAHSVPKVKSSDKMNGRRINVTFRCFK